MIATDTVVRRYLEEALPDGWEPALARVRELAARLEYLTWADRAKLLDEFFWSEAQGMLPTEAVTATVNRHAEVFRPEHPVQGFAATCGAVVTGILLALDEKPVVVAVEQAMTYLLCRRDAFQDAAVEWIAAAGCARLEQHMQRLPGYAFVFLTAFRNDSAESFLARDAFWNAMLGRG